MQTLSTSGMSLDYDIDSAAVRPGVDPAPVAKPY